jgi:transposase
MIVIGADVHKSTHALATVDASTGQIIAEREIVAREQGHLEALRWANNLDGELVWAIEDCRDLSTISSKRSSLPASESCVWHRS